MTGRTRTRALEITRAAVDGGSLRGLGVMYGISHERVRQIARRELRRIAAKFGEEAPTIPEARARAALWRGRFTHEQFPGGDDGNG